jgi:hypothetical protein
VYVVLENRLSLQHTSLPFVVVQLLKKYTHYVKTVLLKTSNLYLYDHLTDVEQLTGVSKKGQPLTQLTLVLYECRMTQKGLSEPCV